MGRVLVTGARGQVGRQLVARGAVACAADVTDVDGVSAVVRAGDVVLNCAAYTKVDRAESEADAAFAVNATGAGNVARACARVGARLIHVSTDYVFPGDADAPYETGAATGPRNVYGR